MLYPPIEPYLKQHLKVDNIHQLYIEECGNPNGLPILYIHGGPGTGCSEDSRRYFDPTIYHIILFDQRGAGQSIPHAELRNNTTEHLLHDIEMIREHLKIDRWILFGGSWGSTLSLIYAETYPEYVIGLILRGVFLARQQDLLWLYGHQGLKQIFPDHWEVFIAPLPKTNSENLIAEYYQLLTNKDEKIRKKAAKAWASWEAGSLTVHPREDLLKKFRADELALNFARIECHYMLNHCFLNPNQILEQIQKIKHIPGIIIHGRYDMVCPVENAWSLHQAWPKSELNIVPAAGHSSSEPGITNGLIHATQKMASLK